MRYGADRSRPHRGANAIVPLPVRKKPAFRKDRCRDGVRGNGPRHDTGGRSLRTRVYYTASEPFVNAKCVPRTSVLPGSPTEARAADLQKEESSGTPEGPVYTTRRTVRQKRKSARGELVARDDQFKLERGGRATSPCDNRASSEVAFGNQRDRSAL